MQKIYRFHFKPINYKKKKKKEVCWLCTTFNPVIRLSIIYHLRAIQPQIPVLNSSAYWEATSCVHVSPTYRPTSTITYSWTAHTVECRLLLFRVLHCTGAVTPRSVFPLYVVNGSVRLGNSESVLTQQPYLSDSSPLSNAAGRICLCCCYTCVRPALQIAVVTTTCTSLHPSTPGAKRHVQQTMRAGTSSSHPDVSVWSVERAAASTSHASSFSKSNQPW